MVVPFHSDQIARDAAYSKANGKSLPDPLSYSYTLPIRGTR
jgi:hypothetical protein